MTLLLFNCGKSFENNEFCEKRAIKDCTTKLSDVFEALEGTTKDHKFNKCAELQVRMIKGEISEKFVFAFAFSWRKISSNFFAITFPEFFRFGN